MTTKESKTLKEKFFKKHQNISDQDYKLKMLYKQSVIMEQSVKTKDNTKAIKGILTFLLVCAILGVSILIINTFDFY